MLDTREITLIVPARKFMENERIIAISATFAAEPLADSVSFWLERMELPGRIRFAPPLQLLQTLLDATSLFNTNSTGLNVVLLRWEDLDSRGDSAESPFVNVSDSLHACLRRAKVPLLVIICLPSLQANALGRSSRYSDWTHRLVKALALYPNVSAITAEELQPLYSVTNPHDSYGNDLALMPYSPQMFAAMGTFISRRFHMLTTPPYKAIVVDCDDTLWEGACGEEGPDNVRIKKPHIALQEFLLSQSQQGALICLCSKNDFEDVDAVFRQRSDMRLGWEHVAASKVNWKPKPDNLLAVAEELGLGTESFVFIDDNPVECKIMRQSLPNVLTLQLPSDLHAREDFLRRVWAFDRPAATVEDRERTVLYERERDRERLRNSSVTLEEFMAGLELSVEFTPLSDENLSRAAQLTFRVNQFNLTTIRRTEAELASTLRDELLQGWLVDVSDRFGAYGMVGLVLFTTTPDSLQVDTFLLSCRALGRGVEHRIVAELGARAKSLGIARVALRLVLTRKNQAARNFLDGDLGSYRQAGEEHIDYRVPVDAALDLRYRPRTGEDSYQAQVPTPVVATERGTLNGERVRVLAWIASEMRDGEAILSAIQSLKRKGNAGLRTDNVSPRTDFEKLLHLVWADVFRLENVSVRDNFFELGGDSLILVRIIVRLYDATGVQVPFRLFFESPTIEEQALKLAELVKESDG